MTFLAKVFRSKDSSAAKKQAKQNTPEQEAPAKPQWTDAWLRTEVTPEEVQELLRGCTQELKGRGLSTVACAYCVSRRQDTDWPALAM